VKGVRGQGSGPAPDFEDERTRRKAKGQSKKEAFSCELTAKG